MSTLPNSIGTGGLTDNGTTQGVQKTNFTNQRNKIAEIPGATGSVELTIDAGVIQPAAGSSGTIRVDTEGNASADDLVTISPTNLGNGAIVRLMPENSARVVTIKDGTGANKIRTGIGDIVLKDKMFVDVQFDSNLGSGEWRVVHVYYADQAADQRAALGLGTAATANTGTSTGNVPTVNQADARYAPIRTPGSEAPSELTISGGSITPTKGQHSVDTESDASTDNLDDIAVTNIPDGGHVLLFAENAGRTVILRHNQAVTNPIITVDGNDISLDDKEKCVTIRRRGSEWVEISRSGFGNKALLGGDGSGPQIPTSGNIPAGTYFHSGDYVTTGTINIDPGAKLYITGNRILDHAVTLNYNYSAAPGSTAAGSYKGAGGGLVPGVPLQGSGGAGGGSAGAGGVGAAGTAGSRNPGGRSVSIHAALNGPSGGSGGSIDSGGTTSGGAGGRAGGHVYWEVAGNSEINANVTGSGEAGANHASDGGSGGGGGGGNWDDRVGGTGLIDTGVTMNFNGGNGGSGGNGGGGGGAGMYHGRFGGALTNNGTITQSGGSAGTGGTSAAGAGSSTSPDIVDNTTVSKRWG